MQICPPTNSVDQCGREESNYAHKCVVDVEMAGLSGLIQIQSNNKLINQSTLFQMVWNPVKYGEIKQMRVSPDKLWLPDIVLFNK